MESKGARQIATVLVCWGVVIAGCETGASQKAGSDSQSRGGLEVSTSPETTYDLQIEIAPDGIYRGRSRIVETKGWRIGEPSAGEGEIPALREALASGSDASNEGAGSGKRNRALVRLHPLVRYDLWSRVVYTVEGAGESDVYGSLAGEGFQDFGPESPRRYATPGTKRAGSSVQFDGLLEGAKGKNKDTSSGRSSAGASTVLTVRVRADGFHVVGPDGPVAPVEGCSDDGASVCVEKSAARVRSLVGEARAAVRNGELETARNRADTLRELYRYRLLYSVVAPLEQKSPELDRLRVEAEPGIPSFLVTEIADHVKVVLPQRSYASRSRYQVARAQAGSRNRALFPTIVLGPSITRANRSSK